MKGQQAAACKKSRGLHSCKDNCLHVWGRLGVCVAYKYRLCRQRGDCSSRGYMPLCPPWSQCSNTGRVAPYAWWLAHPRITVHTNRAAQSAGLKKITKGLFLFCFVLLLIKWWQNLIRQDPASVCTTKTQTGAPCLSRIWITKRTVHTSFSPCKHNDK